MGAAWGLLAAMGCGVGTRDLPELATPQTVPREAYSDRDWALTLAENVVDDGVLYAHLAAHPEPLWRYLTLVERVGPQSSPDQFPTRGQALAYYANVHNACVLRAVIVEGVPDSMYRLDAAPLDQRYSFLVDGRRRTLDDLKELARRAAGIDVRVDFCLCDPAQGAAPLPAEPIRFDDLEGQLERVARAALSRDSLLRVDHAGQRLLLALWITENHERFIEWYRRRMGTPEGTLRNALNALADADCRQKIASAVGYSIAPVPFDRRLNRASPGAPPR